MILDVNFTMNVNAHIIVYTEFYIIMSQSVAS